MTDEHTSTPWQAPVRKRKNPPQDPRFDVDLEWLLLLGDAYMGEHGTLGGTVSVLEHGGAFTGVPNSDLYSDQQVGWGNVVTGTVERHRWLQSAWFTLDTQRQIRLCLWYRAPDAQYRSDEGFGARDACPRAEDIDRNRAIEPQKRSAFHSRRGTEARLGRAAALAFYMADEPGRLLTACQDPNKRKNTGVIARALEKAEAAALEDHAAWILAKEMASPPRRRNERAIVLAYHGSESDG